MANFDHDDIMNKILRRETVLLGDLIEVKGIGIRDRLREILKRQPLIDSHRPTSVKVSRADVGFSAEAIVRRGGEDKKWELHYSLTPHRANCPDNKCYQKYDRHFAIELVEIA